MLNGTETVRFLRLASSALGTRQGAFPEGHVRCVYYTPHIPYRFDSKYVRLRKGLKVPVGLDASVFVFFCRAFLLSLWVGSLLAVARG